MLQSGTEFVVMESSMAVVKYWISTTDMPQVGKASEKRRETYLM